MIEARMSRVVLPTRTGPGEEERGFRRGFACPCLGDTEPGRGRISLGLSPRQGRSAVVSPYARESYEVMTRS